MNVNKAIIVGRLGKDPEVKHLESGQTVTKFSLAVSETWSGKDGKKQETTEWINVSVFGKVAENVGQYLKKGMEAYVEGKIQTRKWEDKEGKTQHSTEILARVVQWTFPPKVKQPDPNQPTLGPEPSFDSSEELPF